MNIEIANIFSDPGWLPYTSTLTKQFGAFPNGLYYNRDNKVAAVVAFRGQHDSWALNQNGMRYILAAVRNNSIADGYVILAAGKPPKVVTYKLVTEVAALLDGVPSRDGDFGNYWWVNEQFVASTQMRVIVDAPF